MVGSGYVCLFVCPRSIALTFCTRSLIFFASALVVRIGKNNIFCQFLFLFLHRRSNEFHRSSVFGRFWVCLFVCLFVCLYVPRLQPLPFDIESWFFAWALILGIGKNNNYCFLKFWFFTELCPFFDFSLYILCNLNRWL